MDLEKNRQQSAKLFREISELKQEYLRNLVKIQELSDLQSDIMYKIEKKTRRVSDLSEDYYTYCYNNKIGEFEE